MTKKAVANTRCPECGESFKAPVDAKEPQGRYKLSARCPRCQAVHESEITHDCLEWDDACNLDHNRFG